MQMAPYWFFLAANQYRVTQNWLDMAFHSTPLLEVEVEEISNSHHSQTILFQCSMIWFWNESLEDKVGRTDFN